MEDQKKGQGGLVAGMEASEERSERHGYGRSACGAGGDMLLLLPGCLLF